MGRENFTLTTKRLIANRAGHQCSFPTCDRRTTGPDSEKRKVSGSGIAAHIYAASPDGPRGQGGLTLEELRQPENGIWFCSDHAIIVDNNRGKSFPPEVLLSYKDLHEARVMREVQGLYSPIGWIHELKINENPLFVNGQIIRFAKLTLLFGNNDSGKTALTQWVAGCFESTFLERWKSVHSSVVHVSLSFLNPKLNNIEVIVDGDRVLNYRIQGEKVPFNPMGLRIIRLTAVRFKKDDDDLKVLSKALSLPPQSVRNLIEEIHKFPHARVKNIKFEADEEDGTINLYCDAAGTVPGLPLHSISGTAVESVFFEFATAAARVSGKYLPTLLILDGCPIFHLDHFFDVYSKHLLDPENQFQTIMCIPSRRLDLDSLRWKGWEVVRTSGKIPSITLTQDLRVIP